MCDNNNSRNNNNNVISYRNDSSINNFFVSQNDSLQSYDYEGRSGCWSYGIIKLESFQLIKLNDISI